MENEILEIKKTSPILISELLGCSLSQVGKFKRGYSGLSNKQALILERELGLSPKAFDFLHCRYQEYKENKQH